METRDSAVVVVVGIGAVIVCTTSVALVGRGEKGRDWRLKPTTLGGIRRDFEGRAERHLAGSFFK